MSTGGYGKGAHIIGFQTKLTTADHLNTFKEADLDSSGKGIRFQRKFSGWVFSHLTKASRKVHCQLPECSCFVAPHF